MAEFRFTVRQAPLVCAFCDRVEHVDKDLHFIRRSPDCKPEAVICAVCVASANARVAERVADLNGGAPSLSVVLRRD